MIGLEIKNKRNMNVAIVAAVYIIVVCLNVWYALEAYRDFTNVYGDKTFSKGIFGVLLCTGGNIVFAVIATILTAIFIKRKLKSNVEATNM